ncbi:MAG TPA: DMT family transporter [Deltaproteobacteria bacterium]|nr:DMT family transporter [Deltaproteobacteria bacterium]
MIRTVFVLFAGIVSISFAAIFIRFCDDVPAIMIATYRLSVASLVLGSCAGFKRNTFVNMRRKDLLLCIAGGIFLALHFITWISSLKYTSVASSVVLVTTNPIFVGVFSFFILREKQNPELVAGIILCFAGSVLIAAGDSGLNGMTITDKYSLIGDALALTGAVMASGYLIVGSKARETVDIMTYVTVVFSAGAVFLLATSLALGISFTGYKGSSYLFMILLAVVPQLIGHTSINWALKHLKASMVAITILGEPIGATILAYIFFNETVGIIQLIGMFSVCAAIITASRKGKK